MSPCFRANSQSLVKAHLSDKLQSWLSRGLSRSVSSLGLAVKGRIGLGLFPALKLRIANCLTALWETNQSIRHGNIPLSRLIGRRKKNKAQAPTSIWGSCAVSCQ